jgi:hypothetical protein
MRHNSIDLGALNSDYGETKEKVSLIDTLIAADARRGTGKKTKEPQINCLHFVEKYALLFVGFMDQVVRVYRIIGLGKGKHADRLQYQQLFTHGRVIRPGFFV